MSAPTTLDQIHGWFQATDQQLFRHFLSEASVAPKGDLVEIGAFKGKSAILIGRYVADGETFTVCDLFGDEPDDVANSEENQRAYGNANLTREVFEENYRAFHDELPRIVHGPSSTILDHVRTGSARFVHLDGSHLYDVVRSDLESARTMAIPGAVVVFDDYRAPHTPGVAAAVWEAVLDDDIQVVCLSPDKLYATFDADASPHRERVLTFLADVDGLEIVSEEVRGKQIVRVGPPWAPPRAVDTQLKALADRLGQVERNQRRTLNQVRRLRDQVGDGSLAARAYRKLRRASP